MIFVGYKAGFAPQVFRYSTIPTLEDCPYDETGKPVFNAVAGPFRTLKGAYFMAEYGLGNPHCRTVQEAERLAHGRR